MKTTLLNEERIKKFDEILSRGLCKGIGTPNGKMCIEAAATRMLDMPFSDKLNNCVTKEIQLFNIRLNDFNWVSDIARAKGLRALGIAQIGSEGIVKGNLFIQKLSTKIISILIVRLFREVHPRKFTDLVNLCEKEPTKENCRQLASAAYAAASAAYATHAPNAPNVTYAAYAATSAADSAVYADSSAADSAVYAAYSIDYTINAAFAAATAYAADSAATATAKNKDKYKILCANLALEVLEELNSPGCAWL